MRNMVGKEVNYDQKVSAVSKYAGRGWDFLWMFKNRLTTKIESQTSKWSDELIEHSCLPSLRHLQKVLLRTESFLLKLLLFWTSLYNLILFDKWYAPIAPTNKLLFKCIQMSVTHSTATSYSFPATFSRSASDYRNWKVTLRCWLRTAEPNLI